MGKTNEGKNTGLKSFNELIKVDLKNEVAKRPIKRNSNLALDYLEWANCIKLLYEHGAKKVMYGMVYNESGYPCFYNQNGESPFVRVWVDIDGERYEEDYPVINGIYVVANPNQMDINKAKQRGFVKAVAINTGLGLGLWIKEEEVLNGSPEIQKEMNTDETRTLNDQITTKFAQALQKTGDKDSLYAMIQSDQQTISKLYRSNDHAEKRIVINQLDVVING